MAINPLSSLEAQDVKVEVSLADYPAIPAVSATFSVNFICDTTIIAVDHSVVPVNSTFNVEIGAAAGPWTMPTFDIESCASYTNDFEFIEVASNTILPELSYVATVTQSNGISQISGSASIAVITDPAYVGYFEVTQRVKISSPLTTTPLFQDVWTFWINFVPPAATCADTTLDSLVFQSSFNINASQGVFNYAVPFPTDSFAGSNSAACGERIFSFTLNSASSIGSIGSIASSFIT